VDGAGLVLARGLLDNLRMKRFVYLGFVILLSSCGSISSSSDGGGGRSGSTGTGQGGAAAGTTGSAGNAGGRGGTTGGGGRGDGGHGGGSAGVGGGCAICTAPNADVVACPANVGPGVSCSTPSACCSGDQQWHCVCGNATCAWSSFCGTVGGASGTVGMAGTGGVAGAGGTGATGTAGTVGGKAGTTGAAGRGGAGGQGGTLGAGGQAGVQMCGPDPSCTRCTTGACCGTGCCGPGESCDMSGAAPVCRCGTGGACTGGDSCARGGPTQVGGANGSDTCGFICCGTTPPGCPVSRRIYKRDIERLDDAALKRVYEELRQIQLTTYAYKADPPKTPRHLGFIIDDTKTPYPINPDGNSVDLYGYMSMAVAAIQTQSKEIEALRAEVAQLRRERRAAR
jgi:hypothetical protein